MQRAERLRHLKEDQIKKTTISTSLRDECDVDQEREVELEDKLQKIREQSAIMHGDFNQLKVAPEHKVTQEDTNNLAAYLKKQDDYL